jgi:hypothetical protein
MTDFGFENSLYLLRTIPFYFIVSFVFFLSFISFVGGEHLNGASFHLFGVFGGCIGMYRRSGILDEHFWGVGSLGFS